MSDKKTYIDKFGEEHGKIAFDIYCVWVNTYGWFYNLRTLCTHDDIIELSEFMGIFYSRLRNLLWQDTILAISRLTDPAEQDDHKNVTVMWLPRICANTTLEADIERLVRDVRRRVNAVRGWRNKVYAHSDLKRRLKPGAYQLPEVNLEKTEAALDAIGAPIGRVHQYCTGASLGAVVDLDDFTGFNTFAYKVLHLVRGARWIAEHMDLTERQSLLAPSNSRRLLELLKAEADDYEALTIVMDFLWASGHHE